jgi:glutamate/tyrosine decarboxylase-like PLP-dependent enzyme
MAGVKFADSFGADFHKTGFCGYSSSVFMIKDKTNLHQIENSYQEDDTLEFSKYSPYNYTLELTRSSHGPVSAFATLKTLGVEGFVKLLATFTESFRYLKDRFNGYDFVEVLNYDEKSNLLFFVFKPDNSIALTENMDPRVVEAIRNFNTGFYQFLIHKLEKGEAQVFFSCSKSHKYLDQSFGSIKVYCWNARFNMEEAKKVSDHIIELFDEYSKGFRATKDYNIFDFLDVKGVKK